MICYMPYTHIDEQRLGILNGAFGAITVHCPSKAMVNGQMRQWAQQELLEIRHPDTVDDRQLDALVREYKAWADVHQGSIGDVAGFFKSRPQRFAMMEDTNPSQIRHQVRHYDEPPESDTAGSLMNAALFLSLAHEFDSQQCAMEREMDAVQALERRMMAHISGDAPDAEIAMPTEAAKSVPSRDQVISPDMIPQRLRAWALIALAAGDASRLYLTPSRSVAEHILDRFPGGAEIYNQPLVLPGNEPLVTPVRMREFVGQISLNEDCEAIEGETHSGSPLAVPHMRLLMYRFANLSPQKFLRALGGHETESEDAGPHADPPAHTVIGLVEHGGP